MQYKNIFGYRGLGFIGSNIVKHLVEQKKNVTIFDNAFRGNKKILKM